jgi:hypothetical protein
MLIKINDNDFIKRHSIDGKREGSHFFLSLFGEVSVVMWFLGDV